MKRMMTAIAVLMCVVTLVPMAVAEEAAADPSPRVRLATTVGDIVFELNREKAPISVENFLQYVRDGFYDGLVFHRVIPTFMIQGGGYDADFNKKRVGVRPPIKNESKNGLSNKRGTIAMARTNAPHSATNEFFINVVDNERLDASDRMPWGYAVFGKVVEGMDIVDKIKNGKLIVHEKDPGRGREGAVNPDPTVVINKATIEGAEKKDKKPDAEEKDEG